MSIYKRGQVVEFSSPRSDEIKKGVVKRVEDNDYSYFYKNIIVEVEGNADDELEVKEYLVDFVIKQFGIFYKSEKDGKEYVLSTPEGLYHEEREADELIESFDKKGLHKAGTFYKKQVEDVYSLAEMIEVEGSLPLEDYAVENDGEVIGFISAESLVNAAQKLSDIFGGGLQFIFNSNRDGEYACSGKFKVFLS